MTPERMAELVRRWVRFYTRDLPEPVARRRIEEIDADLHDHIAHERSRGGGDRRTARAIAARLVRGLPADAAWRRATARAATTTNRLRHAHRRSVVRVTVATALVVLVPLVLTLTGQAAWGVFDFALAAALVAGTGLLLELAARRPRAVALRVGTVAVGLAAMVLGEADDAPGLVLLGVLLLGATGALTLRRAQRSR